MALEVNSLKKAIASLDTSVSLTQDQSLAQFNEPIKKLLRFGVIQNFEFTYELCWKFMKRYLEGQLGSVAVDGVPRAELFRLAAEHHLIDDVSRWRSYHSYRNLTSHVYDEDVAAEIFAIAIKFNMDAKKFLAALEAHND